MKELKDYLIKLNCINTDEIEEYIPILEKYMENILKNNEKINVTSIKEKTPFIRKHYIDSITIIDKEEFKKAKTIIDIGTGGGFPGVPLAILFPDKKFTLVDSVGKKINVIKDSIKDLNLKNIELVNGRAEIIGRMSQHREMYDLCVSRAVAPLLYLLEFALPLVRPGGYFIAYKGPDGIKEIERANNILQKIGGSFNRIEAISPFEGAEDHILVIFNKDTKTSEDYPRRMDQIKRNGK